MNMFTYCVNIKVNVSDTYVSLHIDVCLPDMNGNIFSNELHTQRNAKLR